MQTLDQPSSPTGDRASHFTPVEVLFFKEGEDKATDPVEVDNFDDLAGAKATKPRPGKPRLTTAAAISVACAGVLAGVILWRVETRKGASAQIAAPVLAAAPQAIPPPPAPPAAVPVPSSPVAAPAVPPAPALAAPAPVLPSPETAPAVAPATAPATAPSLPVPAAPTVVFPASTAGASDGNDLRVACKRAVQQHRAKEVLATCGQAFAAMPQSADIAVILARTEFDRGRAGQAMTWAKKAVAIDPEASDAYVFIGGAEQNAGHSQAAKAAYQRYLQLAPRGRYAADLRAVLQSL